MSNTRGGAIQIEKKLFNVHDKVYRVMANGRVYSVAGYRIVIV